MARATIVLSLVTLAALVIPARAADLDEFKVKREAVFEFAEKPVVTRQGDQVTVRFASKALCDATIAIEEYHEAVAGGNGNAAARPRIVRHLASGVLGKNAPPPFQKDSHRQVIVWDGKNDQGAYIDDKDALTVRVSLGLKPRFERTLFWSPYKRIGGASPVICPAPEGVYVLENFVLDHGGYGGSQVKLFDHDGRYLRTVYPFPRGKLDQVTGLTSHHFPHLGRALPLKLGYYQAWLLPTGLEKMGKGGTPHAIAVRGKRIALLFSRLNRLSVDGASPRRSSTHADPLPLGGPKTSFRMMTPASRPMHFEAGPRSAAFSPDGKTLYLAGFVWRWRGWFFDYKHAVLKLDYEAGTEMKVFVGSLKENDWGTDNTKFKVPTSVDCDAKGRVYVSDYLNDRIQVFTPDGKHYKTITVHRPAKVAVNQKTGDIYVFSWMLVTRLTKRPGTRPVFTRLGPVDAPRVITTGPLPLVGHSDQISWNNSGGLPYRIALDSWAKEPTIWLVPGRASWHSSGNSAIALENWQTGIRLVAEQGGKLVTRRNFTTQTAKSVIRTRPPILWRQRLIVNPATGKLYVAESDCGVGKAVNQLVEIRPQTGKLKLFTLPLGAEDLCFDLDGRGYVRTDTMLVRYKTPAWREVPFDYGEQRDAHGWGMGARSAALISGLPTPGHRSSPFWHMGGIDVSAKGHMVVTTCNLTKLDDRRTLEEKRNYKHRAGKKYTPKVYPGRMRWGEIHVYDQRGKPVHVDAVPGMGHLNGIGIDQHDNLYMMAAARRRIRGKKPDPKLPRDTSGTLIKVPAGKARVLCMGQGRQMPVPLPPAAQPKRPIEIQGRPSGWIEGAEWFYGGVGFCTPGGCICCNARFDLDYFNRSFAPEHLTYSVAVLDSAGNLILRTGRYGNVEDGQPLVAKGGPTTTRTIGGDEVALMHACYVATHTDRRLFIADQGNARILSVKLDYHSTETIALKDVEEKNK